MSINKRILLGFILLIIVYSIAGYIGLNNLDKSKELTSQNAMIIQPSIILLSDLQLRVINAKGYTNTWYIVDISDNVDKAALKGLHEEVFPPLIEACKKKSEQWENEKYVEMLDQSISTLSGALMEQKQVMAKLNSIDAYEDNFVRVIEVEQGHLETSNLKSDEAIAMLEILIDYLKKDAVEEEVEVQKSFSSIRTANIVITAISVLISLIVALTIIRAVRLEEQKNVVTEERDEIQEQKAIIEEKNADILSSITYAKRIQNSILPENDDIEKQFDEHFVLYKPRDIVSGDFYWYRALPDGRFLIAAADSTGHGVPGAFVSLVCYNSLNRAMDENGLETPGPILNKAREYVVSAFEDSSQTVRDGMDIALCYFDLSSNEMKFAGAHNSAYILRNGELLEVESDRMPVGVYERSGPFNERDFTLQKGDQIYIFSDGLGDQFGGPKERKFKVGKLKELIVSLENVSMEETGSTIEKTITDWQGDTEQLDDWLMIGMKI